MKNNKNKNLQRSYFLGYNFWIIGDSRVMVLWLGAATSASAPLLLLLRTTHLLILFCLKSNLSCSTVFTIEFPANLPPKASKRAAFETSNDDLNQFSCLEFGERGGGTVEGGERSRRLRSSLLLCVYIHMCVWDETATGTDGTWRGGCYWYIIL